MQLEYSPILPDGDLFSNDILGSHHPSLVKFSRQYQQTAIKWTPGVSSLQRLFMGLWADKVLSDLFWDEIMTLREELSIIRMPFYYMLERKMEQFINCAIADIEGDADDIAAVKTRKMIIFAPGSEPARILSLLEKGVAISCQEKDARVTAICSMLMRLIGPSSREEAREESRVWNEHAPTVNLFLKQYGIEGHIPESRDFVAAEKVFNASAYWRDWYRTSE
jgi:hypothetical protein